MQLPPGVRVFERGWLSANNVLFDDGARAALIDSGYGTHAGQTLELVAQALGARPLDLLVNTHLHSDHCGGNAALQEQYPSLRTLIPPGDAVAVRSWDEDQLSYRATGQLCTRFRIDGLVQPGERVRLGAGDWDVHAAPGHDPHAVLLFEPMSRTLISGDALWRNGFGIVFPELDGEPGFDDVALTLDVVQRLTPAIVIPGHGAVFTEVADALAVARSRLDAYVRDPLKHARHGTKVLLKYKLLELQSVHNEAFERWALATPNLQRVHARYFADVPPPAWLAGLIGELVNSGAAAREGDLLLNC